MTRDVRDLVVEEIAPMLRAEWGRAWSVRAPTGWLLLAVGVAVVTAATLANDFVHATTTGEVGSTARLAVVEATGPAVLFGQVAAASFGLHLATPDHAHGSIGPIVAARPRRWVVVVAKAGVALLAAAVTGAVLGPVVTVVTDLVLGSRRGAGPDLAIAAVTTATVLASAALVGVGLGVLTRGAVAALSSSFVLLVVTLAAPGPVGRWLPGPAASDLLVGGPGAHRPLVAAAVLLGWVAVVLGVAVRSSARRDVGAA